ncbi:MULTISPECIES: antibiotic biosynthesis monooxygenase [unclassified Acinetobacter]|uniref:antibiotic biosynthesis monooxygenase family protein n=1 Tax=unclassified Acinetobacter TaxID=196816 RepID=UPI0015D426B0|nr:MULTISPECIES: antibiotic biosynthesis monooxygenase [unclassified Acinetobacter]
MQYVVIFKARICTLDEPYFSTAQQLRDKALTHFNCQHFEALTEGEHEIALSYWNTLEDIRAWQQDAQHLVAQQLGKNQWYASFSVEICEVLRRYRD